MARVIASRRLRKVSNVSSKEKVLREASRRPAIVFFAANFPPPFPFFGLCPSRYFQPFATHFALSSPPQLHAHFVAIGFVLAIAMFRDCCRFMPSRQQSSQYFPRVALRSSPRPAHCKHFASVCSSVIFRRWSRRDRSCAGKFQCDRSIAPVAR